MADIEKMVEQLDALLAQVGGEDIRTLVFRLEGAITRLSPPGSSYRRQLATFQDVVSLAKAREVVGIATSLRDDLKDGWVESVVEVVHADTYSDYLEMADGLLSTGHKDAAAVIAGTSLEVHVRSLCVKHQVEIRLPDGSHKNANGMNADLKKAGVYGNLDHKQLIAWMDLRNNAAHGNYDEYDTQQVRHLIDGVRTFMLKYPA